MYKVAYATGSRADYGIVTRYLEKLNNDPEIQLDILVTGSHMDDKYGKSYSGRLWETASKTRNFKNEIC